MLRKLKLLTTATFVFGLCLSTAFGASESRRIEVQPLRPSTAPSSSDSEADLAAAAADRPATAPGAFYGEMVSGVPDDRMKKIDLKYRNCVLQAKSISVESKRKEKLRTCQNNLNEDINLEKAKNISKKAEYSKEAELLGIGSKRNKKVPGSSSSASAMAEPASAAVSDSK